MNKLVDFKVDANISYDNNKITINSTTGAELIRSAVGDDEAIGITPASGGVITNPDNMTDGDLNTYGYLATGDQYAEIDLGSLLYLKEIRLYHLVGAGNRKYNDVIVQASVDGLAWSNLFNTDKNNNAGQGVGIDNEYVESDNGKTISANGVQFQYIRVWGNGYNGLANVTEIREIEVREAIYHKDNSIINTTEANIFDVTNIMNITETKMVVGSDNVKYNIGIDGKWLYWDGAEFSESDGTYNQSNDMATLISHLGVLFSAPKRVNVSFKAFLHSGTGATTPKLNNLSVNYDLHEAFEDEKMTLYLQDLTAGIRVKVNLRMGKRSTPVYDNGNPIVLDVNDRQIIGVADNNGYVELKLYANKDSGGTFLITSGSEVYDTYDFTVGDDNPITRTIIYSSTAVNLADILK